MAYNNGAANVSTTRPITGIGSGAAYLTISDGATYNYGTKANGSVTSKTFTITNTGAGTATTINESAVTAPYRFAGGGAFPGTGGTCVLNGSLAAAATCTFIVEFAPISSGGYLLDMQINYFDGAFTTAAIRTINGVGVTPSLLTISDGPTYDYGPVSSAAPVDKILTVSNTGSFTATAMVASGLSGSFLFTGGTYPGTGGTCSTTLAGNTSCK